MMSKDQTYGFAIFLISVVVAIIYSAALFAPFIGLPPQWKEWAVGIPVLLIVLLVLVISAWIGWTMLTTPPPAPFEPETSSGMSSDATANPSLAEKK